MKQNTPLIKTAETYFKQVMQGDDEYRKKHFLFRFDEDAKEFLIQNNILKQLDKCPECGSKNIKRRGDNSRCLDCEARWNIRRKSILEDRDKFSYTEFMKCLNYYSKGYDDHLIKDKFTHIYVSRLLDEIRKKINNPIIELPEDGEYDIYLGLNMGKIILFNKHEPKIAEHIHLKLLCTEADLTDFSICRIKNNQIIEKGSDELGELQDLIGKRLSIKIGEYIEEINYYFSDLIHRYNDPSAYLHMNIIKKIAMVN